MFSWGFLMTAALTLEQRVAKRRQAQQLMQDMGIPMWITWVEDNAAEEAHLPLIGAHRGAATVAYVLTPEKAVSFCPSIEAQIQRDDGFEVVELKGRGVLPPLVDQLGSVFGEPIPDIALNYSGTFGAVDTLGHGNYMAITRRLAERYHAGEHPDSRFMPADELIMAIASAKLPFEIDYLREASQITYAVLDEAFPQIRSGMTEKDAAALVQSIAEARMAKDSRLGYSWAKGFNPIVLTGDGIAGSPHAPPSDRVIQSGSTVYMDFGISVNGYHGDLQHFGYVLQDGETEAPQHVLAMYELLVRSITAGMRAALPGVRGYEVDEVCRKIITSAGHPSFKHGTGHQLGAGNTHTPGAAFTVQFSEETGLTVPESHLKIQKGFTMTIEPRIQIANGASIEIDGVITDAGFEPFAPIQERIYLVR